MQVAGSVSKSWSTVFSKKLNYDFAEICSGHLHTLLRFQAIKAHSTIRSCTPVVCAGTTSNIASFSAHSPTVMSRLIFLFAFLSFSKALEKVAFVLPQSRHAALSILFFTLYFSYSLSALDVHYLSHVHFKP